jgi:formylglycine-generating enzyme required for sulfatase activity
MFDVGTILDDRYRIDAKLGEGGMGVVYRAYDIELEKTIALKALLPQFKDDPESQRDLKREVAVSQGLAHRNIVQVFHLETRSEVPYLIMEFVDGVTLAFHKGQKGKLGLEETLSLAKPILSAIAYAHERGLVHRDIKPQNIMISNEGEVKVMDFGIAQVLKDTYTKLTGRPVSGTLYYMAPEHIRGKPPDKRSDIYSLGCLFYELLNGKPPFWTGDVVYQQINEQPAPLEGVPHRISGVILRCLAKEPSERFQSVEEISLALLGGGSVKDKVEVSTSQSQPLTGRAPIPKMPAPQPAVEKATPRPATERPPAQPASKEPAAQESSKGIGAAWVAFCKLSAAWKAFWGLAALLILLVLTIGVMKGWGFWQQDRKAEVKWDEEGISNEILPGEVAYPQEWTNSIGMKFHLIPAGEFMMGAVPGDDQAEYDEEPRHRVEITKPFYMSVYEVTQAQYQAVMGENPSNFKGDDHPVESVSWNDAVEFCEKLSLKEGKKYRMPTEAEWEYACRAGIESAYYWGNGDSESEMKKYAWYEKNADDGYWTSPHASREGTQSVGQKLPNAWGLYDMSGNVWEWCSDWYSENYCSNSPAKDPQGSSSGELRVLRGGSWHNQAGYLRTSNRSRGNPDDRGVNGGFRILRDEK